MGGFRAGYSIVVNKHGAVVDWPNGFLDHSCGQSEAILRKAMEMRNKWRRK